LVQTLMKIFGAPRSGTNSFYLHKVCKFWYEGLLNPSMPFDQLYQVLFALSGTGTVFIKC
ncbi:unnamed protein product, partial [Rotaria sp. Silwood2]